MTCKYCLEYYSRSDNLKTHQLICKEKYESVRNLELQLDVDFIKFNKNQFRFCHKHLSKSSNYTWHIKTCKAKQDYRKSLEARVKENQKHQNISD